jgi:hypothetical protein
MVPAIFEGEWTRPLRAEKVDRAIAPQRLYKAHNQLRVAVGIE